jgi:hypothetical protein
MARFAMDIHKQRFQVLGEANVIVRATETSLLAELEKCHAADRAGALIEPGEFFRRFTNGQMLGQQRSHGRDDL